MMKRHTYYPPIELIEQRLIGIPDGLIEAVRRGETSPAISQAVMNSPEWLEYQQALGEAELAANEAEDAASLPTEMPDFLKDLVRRRVAANALASTPLPAAGQIVTIEQIVTPRPGQMDAIMMAPLYVLLDAPAEQPALWHGWLMGAETDYAGWWDFVLQEEDSPFEPEAAMVQMWNPVRLYLPMATRVVGILSPARMQAVRALAAEFATSDPPVDVPVWPGRIANRTTLSNLSVSTGSPLGDVRDERHRYQHIYFEAAEAVREPARLALRELASIPAGETGSLLNRLIAAAARLAEVLIPEPKVAIAMSGEEVTEVPDLVWPGIARLSIQAAGENSEGQLCVTVIGDEAVTAEVLCGTLVEEHVEIASGKAETLYWGSDSTALKLASAGGKKLDLNLRDLR